MNARPMTADWLRERAKDHPKQVRSAIMRAAKSLPLGPRRMAVMSHPTVTRAKGVIRPACIILERDILKTGPAPDTSRRVKINSRTLAAIQRIATEAQEGLTASGFLKMFDEIAPANDAAFDANVVVRKFGTLIGADVVPAWIPAGEAAPGQYLTGAGLGLCRVISFDGSTWLFADRVELEPSAFVPPGRVFGPLPLVAGLAKGQP